MATLMVTVFASLLFFEVGAADEGAAFLGAGLTLATLIVSGVFQIELVVWIF